MQQPQQARYCHCGTRLARDNRTRRCRTCQRAARDLRLRPPSVPAEFWHTDHMRDALASWHMGKVMRAFRTHPHHGSPIPQEVAAGWVRLTQAQLSRIENGTPITDLTKLTHWARTLAVPSDLLWFKMPAKNYPTRQPDGSTVPRPIAPASVLVSKLHSTLESPHIMPTSFGVDHSTTSDVAAMQAFRAADRQVGGGHLYTSVVRYLHTAVAPRLFGGAPQGEDGKTMFTSAAALTEMAGWMAHEAGHDTRAEQHFERALDLVRIGQDRQLQVHVLTSMSYLAHHMAKPDDAIRLAHAGEKSLSGGPRHPHLQARVLAMQARGFAALRKAREAHALLHDAERALSSRHDESPSPWVSQFDEASLASEASRCFRDLGQLHEARRQAERVLELRSPNRTRSRAFGHLTLVTVLIRQGKPDEACVLAQQVLDSTHSLGSYPVVQQLLNLRRLLEPYASNMVVNSFLNCLAETLRQRLVLYPTLSPGVRDASTDHT